jgi:hypothetical protein
LSSEYLIETEGELVETRLELFNWNVRWIDGGSDILLNHHLSQKFKLVENDWFNHLINILMGSNPPLINEVQNTKYLIKNGGEL